MVSATATANMNHSAAVTSVAPMTGTAVAVWTSGSLTTKIIPDADAARLDGGSVRGRTGVGARTVRSVVGRSQLAAVSITAWLIVVMVGTFLAVCGLARLL
jgi:3-oxoacyl-ACP reductase-like protein